MRGKRAKKISRFTLAHRAITLGERQEEGTTVFELTRASDRLFLARPTMRAIGC